MNRALLGFSALAALTVGLGGCATRTPVSGTFPSITPRQAQSNRHSGATVRWGGVLIKTNPEAGKTCFHVISLPLSGNGRPEVGSEKTQTGRFIACAQGFYDPVLYAAGRRITFIGTIVGVVQEAIGGYKYPYPKLDARIVYLWPKASTERRPYPYHGPYYWGPWNPWGPGWWWSTYGYWPPPYPHDRDHDHHRRSSGPTEKSPAPPPRSRPSIRPSARPGTKPYVKLRLSARPWQRSKPQGRLEPKINPPSPRTRGVIRLRMPVKHRAPRP